MKQDESPSLKARLHDALAAMPDFYCEFEICTWGFAEDEQEVLAIIEFVRDCPEASTSDVIRFHLWYQDQRGGRHSGFMNAISVTSLDECGTLTVPRPDDEPLYDLRAILQYQKETGTRPEEMTTDLLKPFIIKQ